MGGYGSSRWGRHIKKTTVNECFTLDAAKLRELGLLTPGDHWGSLQYSRGGRPTGKIAYNLDASDPTSPRLRLIYTVTDRQTGEKTDLDYKIPLAPTWPNYGGRRWWLVCPLVRCGRRVRVLYLPPGGLYFGCRHCYKLTYTSCQESDPRLSSLRRQLDGGADLRAMLDGGQADPILVLKLMGQLLGR